MFLDLLAALLPSPEREALVRRGADPFRWSLGFAEFFLGANLLLENARAFDLAQSSTIATYLLEKVGPQALGSFESRLAFKESGTVVWLAWILLPTTWLLVSIPLTFR